MDLAEFKSRIPNIFGKVKEDVKSVLGQHRAGISLGLAELGISREKVIGGLHLYPGNQILINISPLKVMLASQPNDIVWAYAYHVLLSLYLKSLGVINKRQCKELTLRISKEIFKQDDHPTIILAKQGIGYFIPKLKIHYIPPKKRPDGMSIEYITDLDDKNQSYFS